MGSWVHGACFLGGSAAALAAELDAEGAVGVGAATDALGAGAKDVAFALASPAPAPDPDEGLSQAATLDRAAVRKSAARGA